MTLKESVDMLNEFGAISNSMLQRKFKVSHTEAGKILKKMADLYENVFFTDKCENIIYIAERCPYPDKKYKLPRKKRKSKWIDVTQA